MNQINGMDDIFLHFEHSGLPMHVGSVALYHPPSAWRGRSNFAQIRESIWRGVGRTPVLRQRLVRTPLHLDRPHWTRTGRFQLDEHIRRISLPRPGSWEQLRSVVSRVFEEPLDLARPLFQVTVIEDLGGVADLPPGSFALLTKLHHAALDGVSAVEVMRTFCDASMDDVEAAPDLDGRQSEPTVASLLGRAWLNQLERGLGAARLAATLLRTLARPRGTSSRSDSVTTEAKPVPRIRFNGCPSSSRAFGGCHFSLSEVQAVRHAVPGATVNDVVLTVVGGALRRVLEEHGDLPSDPVVAMAPISIRSKEEGADSGEATGNRVSMMAVGLGTDIADPLERLEVVHRTARSSKQSSSASGSNTLLDIANLVPSALGELVVRAYRGLGLSSLHPALFSCVVTNVPGPREALFLAGGRMVACYGMGPIFDGVGLIHPVLSYDGGITISFTSCPEMLPNPAYYEECIHEAFEELAQAAGVLGTTDLAAAGRPGR